MKFHRFAAAAAAFCIILPAASLLAQTFLFQSQTENRAKFGLRFLRPNFAGDSKLSTFSGTYDLWVSAPVGRTRANFVATVPFNAFSAEGADGESGVGNIYIGTQARLGDSTDWGMNVSLGVFLPTASEKKASTHFLGLLADIYELQRSSPQTLTIYGNFAYHYRQVGRGMFGVEIGPQLLIPTGELEGDAELFGHYGLAAGFPLDHVALFAELLGVFIISEDVDDFGDRFTHSLAFGAQLTTSQVRPGLFYMLPLDDDFNDFLDGTLGLKVDFVLK
jgi:hypothetical protein